MKTIHCVYFKDSRNMQAIGSASVELVVTSPPYPMIEMWDESFSTQEARQARITMGTSRSKRHGHLDDLAATVILQSFLDSPEK